MKHERYIERVDLPPLINRLVEIRLAWGLPAKEVAGRIGISPGSFGSLERGERNPGLKVLARWAEILGYELSLKPRSAS